MKLRHRIYHATLDFGMGLALGSLILIWFLIFAYLGGILT